MSVTSRPSAEKHVRRLRRGYGASAFQDGMRRLSRYTEALIGAIERPGPRDGLDDIHFEAHAALLRRQVPHTSRIPTCGGLTKGMMQNRGTNPPRGYVSPLSGKTESVLCPRPSMSELILLQILYLLPRSPPSAIHRGKRRSSIWQKVPWPSQIVAVDNGLCKVPGTTDLQAKARLAS